MLITIKTIDPRRSVPVPGTARLGCPAEFETPVVHGFATVVPSASGSRNLGPGKKLDVDVKQEYVGRFRALGSPRPAEIRPLEAQGDYSVCGPVIFSYDTGDFGVEVGGFLFTLNRDDARGKLPPAEQWVSFEVHGLSLWDRGA